MPRESLHIDQDVADAAGLFLVRQQVGVRGRSRGRQRGQLMWVSVQPVTITSQSSNRQVARVPGNDGARECHTGPCTSIRMSEPDLIPILAGGKPADQHDGEVHKGTLRPLTSGQRSCISRGWTPPTGVRNWRSASGSSCARSGEAAGPGQA